MFDKDRQHWYIEIERVANGYLLQVSNGATYETRKTIHETPKAAIAALYKICDGIADAQLALPSPEE